MNRQPDSSEDTEALRQEIQAAIAAGRELNPDMDKHLADSVLDRYHQDQAARQRALARSASRGQSPGQPSPAAEVAQVIASNLTPVITGVVGVAALIAILLLQPHLWWLIFLVPGIFFGWSRRARGEYYSRRARRLDDSQGPQASSGGQNSLNPPTNQPGRDVEML
jgi:hypothetical protein